MGYSRYPALPFDLPKEPSSPYINRFLSADTIVPGYANPQNLNRYSYVTNNPLRYTDPTGHFCVEEGFEGSCVSVLKKADKKWQADRKKRKLQEEIRRLRPSGPACSGSNQSVMCLSASGSTTDMPIDLGLQYLPSASPSFSGELDNLISQIEFGVDAMDLLDLVEDGIHWGKPVYKHLKYAIPLGGYEYAADGLLQLYDDRNKNLQTRQLVGRGILRSGESAVADGMSVGVGLLTAAAVQASVPIPFVSAGAGYVVGSYSTSAIVDNFFINQVNPYVFNRWLGGP